MAEQEFRHLVRIVNTDLDGTKQLYHALRKIKGVGVMYANMVCALAKIDRSKKTGYLTDEEVKKINDALLKPLDLGTPVWMLNRRKDYETGEDKHLLAADISFMRENDIKRLKMIKSYRGYRHAYGLPVRGQKTRSNFRRNKGKVLGVKRSPHAKAGRV